MGVIKNNNSTVGKMMYCNVAYFGGSGEGGGFSATLTVTYDEGFYGATITATDGTTTMEQVATSSGSVEFENITPGEWTISATVEGQTYSDTITIIDEFELSLESGPPNGKTVLPINDVPTWLACGEIENKNYTTLAEVLTDEECFAELLGNSNACAYMARSTDWASTITTNERAMEMVGMFDVACKKLLANEDWLEAIASSEYRDYVLNTKVPQMTSPTTPSGVVSVSSQYDSTSGNAGWAAFNNTSGYGWATANGLTSGWIQYQFPEPMAIKAVECTRYSGYFYCNTMVLEASNDGTNWTTLDDAVKTDSDTVYITTLDNDTAYSYYRLSGNSLSPTTGVGLRKLNFIGRIYTAMTKGIIHSAANDTIYYTSEGTNIPVATTDANGDAEIDFTELDPGIYTLYSTVAKEQVSFTNAYSKQIHITKNTKEVYFMPINYYYWYGRERIPFTTLAIVMFSYGDRWSKSGTINRSTNSMSYQLTNNTAPEGGFVVPNRMTKGLLGKYVKSHYNITKINSQNANFVGALRNSGNKNMNNYYYASLYAQANQDTAIAVDEAYIGFGVDEAGNQNTDIVTLYSLFLQNTY